MGKAVVVNPNPFVYWFRRACLLARSTPHGLFNALRPVHEPFSPMPQKNNVLLLGVPRPPPPAP